MNNVPDINGDRLLRHLTELGQIGIDSVGWRTRLAGTDEDKLGRDAFVQWLSAAGLRVEIDKIGNIFGVWETDANRDRQPLMLGSHIDTVIDAGALDGCYGVLAALEVIQSLKEAGTELPHPVVVAAFTNEEGVRFAPDMMGSLAFVGGLSLKEALCAVDVEGTTLGAELSRIGYFGTRDLAFLSPFAYVELHIEQGPILHKSGTNIGVVENLQGISWQRVSIEGVANHAGTTPMSMRSDAGVAAAKIIAFMSDTIAEPGVATVGTIALEPNAINVVPSKCTFTVDIRHPDADQLQQNESDLRRFIEEVSERHNVSVSIERLSRFEPVQFDPAIVDHIEQAAAALGFSHRRMTSGAGHDAQMLARVCPTAMIFVPSIDGISHNPKEATSDADLVAGARVLRHLVVNLISQWSEANKIGEKFIRIARAPLLPQ